MEIGDERIRDFEIVRRINKNVCFAGAGGQAAGRWRGDTFQNPHGGRANGDDTTIGFFCLIDGARRFRADFKPLLVHPMFGQRIHLDRCECSQPDVEGHFRGFNATRLDSMQNLGSEVQTCSRCRDGW